MLRFVAWVCINGLLGFLPSGLTALAFFLRTKPGEALRVEELMFSSFMMIATTTMDLVIIELSKTFKTIFSAVLLVLSVAATALYCANLFGSGDVDKHLLVALSIALTGIVAVSTVAIQIFILRNGKPEDEDHQKITGERIADESTRQPSEGAIR